MQIIGNGTLITRNEVKSLIFDGAVVVEANTIVDYGKTSDMTGKYQGAEFTDVQDKLIMPGLLNTHMHIYSAFARGMILTDGKISKNFAQILENLWWRLDKTLTLEDVKFSAYTTYIESIKNGVTTVFDHHASQNDIESSLFTIKEVAKELGIRTSLCYEVTDRDGKEATNRAIKENVDFIKYAAQDETDMFKGMFGLHASFTVSDATLERCVSEMADLNAGFHVHTAEGIDDLYDSLRKYNKRVVNRFHDMGVLGKKTIAVHGIHINDAEMGILKETDTIVVHNPESNMGNAVGCAAILKLLEKGILLGLGTDGYTTDMLESYKVANILHKHVLCDPSVAWMESAQMLFDNNRKIAERYFKQPLGVIEKGAYADVIVVDYNPLTPLHENNINGHLLFGVMGRNVVSTMINGKFVLKDREIIAVDEKEIFAKSRVVSGKFWKRINS
ncbi:MAG: putative aminohydrolase SsnA [SAR324 cluster bacterium]|nr:putative aminohydrolase SsnA [SAR324 cluster bacterium]